MKACFSFIIASMIVASHACNGTNKTIEGKLIRLEEFSSMWADQRLVDVWLPPGYDLYTEKQFPVIYMHDGQNLFAQETAFGGVEWGIDETITRLINEKKTDGCIVVGIWNTPKRFFEYAPNAPFRKLSDTTKQNLKAEFGFGNEPLSDQYLQFIVKELKPYIDSCYRTLHDRQNTFVMGSSMGGLISMYALAEYPDVFGGAACISTHWPFRIKDSTQEFTRACVEYLAPKIESLKQSKWYFDYGTENLDASYEANQLIIDSLFQTHGFGATNYKSIKFPGHDHNEKSWSTRAHIPISFLLGVND